ncbi:hypothetical protein E2562_012219 [Oryza meyeriana var. granulata]|uniref:Uncharacterized protein n=1 Tax=Oryza meyeriana var. granulata TaxID=110450 RepID=A0A6G1D2S2_9ORYZ|nr:hypothetical protein E2562_012219 [Oryza meyeriana var. granulata]
MVHGGLAWRVEMRGLTPSAAAPAIGAVRFSSRLVAAGESVLSSCLARGIANNVVRPPACQLAPRRRHLIPRWWVGTFYMGQIVGCCLSCDLYGSKTMDVIFSGNRNEDSSLS